MNSEKIINLYAEGHGANYIAKLYNSTPHYVYKILKQNNIRIRSHREKSLKYTVNNNYFDEINSEDKAYWLGFLSADGYISNNNLIGLALSIKDEEHIYKFKASINATYPVNQYIASGYSTNKYSRLVINSPQMWESLTALGFTKTKTYDLRFPKLDNNLYAHYIRGYFDGDGSWSISKKSLSGYTMKICGNDNFLKVMADHLSLSHNFIHKHKSIYCLEKSGKDVLRLMNYMYSNATIFLSRKRERWFLAQSLLAEKLIE